MKEFKESQQTRETMHQSESSDMPVWSSNSESASGLWWAFWKFDDVSGTPDSRDKTFIANKGSIRFVHGETAFVKRANGEEQQLSEKQLLRLRWRLDQRLEKGKLSGKELQVAKQLVSEICFISARSKGSNSNGLKLKMKLARLAAARRSLH